MSKESDDIPHRNRPEEKNGSLNRCSSCRTVGYEGDIYCVRCGVQLAPVCERCGARIAHPVAIYCVKCGEKLHERTQVHQSFRISP